MIPLAAWFTGHWPLSPIHSWRADLATWLYTQLSRHSVIIGLIIRIGLASYAPSQRLMLQSNQEFSIHSLVHATGAHPPSPRGGLRPTTAKSFQPALPPACSPAPGSYFFKDCQSLGPFLGVRWLRLCIANAGYMDSIPGWGTKNLHAVWCGQKVKKEIKKYQRLSL